MGAGGDDDDRMVMDGDGGARGIGGVVFHHFQIPEDAARCLYLERSLVATYMSLKSWCSRRIHLSLIMVS